ncbi:AAA family ATPase [Colwellia sp. UCD-KL20]|uniref:AAA family ATPase n=1 Tax=Colwellia sp. UCD-KL20 TaxID=1917165 RepID=UPI000970E61A|nr:AAA family ATPase [Colwellia sp. UCD-KL20]
MSRVVIFGNSGSGKSTLAKNISTGNQSAHLDLDSIAWQPTTPPSRTPIAESKTKIDEFLKNNNAWVIEGCYTDLLELVTPIADKVIFLNLSVEDCIRNAQKRPWEPYKYESKAAQDANLAMLIDWISQYTQRDDTFSQSAHLALFNGFEGAKELLTCNLPS